MWLAAEGRQASTCESDDIMPQAFGSAPVNVTCVVHVLSCFVSNDSKLSHPTPILSRH